MQEQQEGCRSTRKDETMGDVSQGRFWDCGIDGKECGAGGAGMCCGWMLAVLRPGWQS